MMISRLSKGVLIYLLKSKVISKDETDFYKYGIEITLSSRPKQILCKTE